MKTEDYSLLLLLLLDYYIHLRNSNKPISIVEIYILHLSEKIAYFLFYIEKNHFVLIFRD